jgi:ABC-2 type transport system ATP-binding protein
MRALVKRLADSGLTVLLSSHDMAEVEEICDNVTIMRTGSVVFHGSITELRTRAPDPSHRLETSDDAYAIEVAREHGGVAVDLHSDGALSVHGRSEAVDAYVVSLGRAGVAVRSLVLELAPLESLFFMLTDTDRGQAGTAPAAAVRR